jgi:hypothetical protein
MEKYRSEYEDIYSGEIFRIRYHKEKKIFLVIDKWKHKVIFATNENRMIRHFKSDLRKAYRAIDLERFV